MKNAIRTKHNLDFKVCDDPMGNGVMRYMVGTCNGQYEFMPFAIAIISIVNDSPGNGHLDDVFEWFEYAAKRDKKPLMIMEFFNQRFKQHCILKRGFMPVPGTNNVVKFFL